MYPFPSMPILPFLHCSMFCSVVALPSLSSLSSLPSCVLLAFCWRSGVRSRGCFRCIVCWRSGVFRSSGVLPCLLASVVSLVAFWRFGVLAYWRSGVGAFFFVLLFLYLLLGFCFGGLFRRRLAFWSSGVLVSCFCFLGGGCWGFCFRRSGVLAFSHVFWGFCPRGFCPHLVDLATCRHQKGMS